MPLDKINDVVRFGLSYERSRVEAASHNIAMANVALRPDAASPLLTVSAPTSFSRQLGGASPVIKSQQTTDTRLVLDPENPLADSDGMVRYPKIDMANEMATLVSATRAYEANVRAYNSLQAMSLKAFEIGK